MKKEKLQELASKYADHSASDQEKAIFNLFMDDMQEIHSDQTVRVNDLKKQRILSNIERSIIGFSKPISERIVRIAAVLIILISIGFLSEYYITDTITLQTQKGEQKELVLEDGSSIFLNANSKLSYPRNFKENRQVELTGEAFFKVRPDADHPFTVRTNKLTTRVLGTSFNINTYDKYHRVSVSSGRVEVKLENNPNQLFELTRGQKINYSDKGVPKIAQADSKDFDAWTRRIILLDNTTLQQTARIIENWYDVQIVIEDEKLKDQKISGKFNDESLSTVLKSIALLKNLKIELNHEKRISIRENQQPLQ